jgi:hypothetical protein
MRLRTVILMACVAMVLAFGWTAMVQAQSQKVYTFSWYHDGVGTDAYNVVVDGGAPLVVPMAACSGNGAARLCSADVTLTTSVDHTVTIQAVNIFGVNVSDPFSATAPKTKPTGVTAKVKQ